MAKTQKDAAKSPTNESFLQSQALLKGDLARSGGRCPSYPPRHREVAPTVRGLAPFAKLAYPEMTGAASPAGDGGGSGEEESCLKEPLNENDNHVYRYGKAET